MKKIWIIPLVLIAALVIFAGTWKQTDSTNRYYKLSHGEHGLAAYGAYSASIDNLFNKVWRDAPINVKSDYGAKGDGVTSDSPAFQAAYDSLSSVYGGEIIVPPGRYYTPVAITGTKPNVTIRGLGNSGWPMSGGIGDGGATLITDKAIYILDLGSAAGENKYGPEIQNLAFYDSSGGTALGAIRIQRMHHANLENLMMWNFQAGYGVFLDGSADNIQAPSLRKIKAYKVKYPIYCDTVIALDLYDAVLSGPSGSPIASSIALRLHSDNSNVQSVKVDDFATGIKIEGLGNFISGNSRFEDNTLALHLAAGGIDNAVLGNYFTNNTTAIQLDSDLTTQRNIIGSNFYVGNTADITNNTIGGATPRAYYINEPQIRQHDLAAANAGGDYEFGIQNRSGSVDSSATYSLQTRATLMKAIFQILYEAANPGAYIGTTTDHKIHFLQNNSIVGTFESGNSAALNLACGFGMKAEVGTMTGNETFYPTEGNVFIKDPAGNRNFNPVGTFQAGAVVYVINTADAAETITFDSAGLNQAIAQNERGIFAFDGTDWLKVYVGS